MSIGQVRLDGRGAEVLVHERGSRRACRRSAPGRSRSSGDRPIAESNEYRPPTQSQNPNMLAGSIPNSVDLVGVGRDRDEVLARPPRRRRAPRATTPGRTRALVMVSSVVNVFDATMNSVVSGSRSRVASTEVGAVDVGDEPVGHRPVGERRQRGGRHARPEVAATDADVDDRFDPPAGVTRPVARAHTIGERAPSGRAPRALRNDVHAVDHDGAPRGARSATWSTDRSSVTLIFSPRNIASRSVSTPARRGHGGEQRDRVGRSDDASSSRGRGRRPRATSVVPRSGSAAKRSRRWRIGDRAMVGGKLLPLHGFDDGGHPGMLYGPTTRRSGGRAARARPSDLPGVDQAAETDGIEEIGDLGRQPRQLVEQQQQPEHEQHARPRRT